MPSIPRAQEAGLGLRARQATINPNQPVPNLAEEGAATAQQAAAVADQAGANVLAAENRIRTREEAIGRVNGLKMFQQAAQDELSRLQTEADLTDSQVNDQFGAFLAERRAEALSQFGGREASRAALESRLLDLESQSSGQLAGEIIRTQRQATASFLGDQIKSIASGVVSDASSLDSALIAAQSEIDELAGGLDRGQEDAFRRGARSELFTQAATGLLNRGDIEGAEAILARPDFIEAVDSATRERVENRIRQQNQIQDQFVNEIRAREQALGRPLTDPEMNRLLGIANDEPLVEIADGNGGSVLVPQSEAIGQSPFRPEADTRLQEIELQTAQARLQGLQQEQEIQSQQFEREAATAERERAKEIAIANSQRTTQAQEAARVVDLGEQIANSTDGILGFDAFGGIAGRIPNGPLDAAVEGLQSQIELIQLKNAREQGITFGSLTEGERKAAGAAASQLSRLQEPEDFARELLNAQTILITAQFGTDDKINLAQEVGELTPAEAAAQKAERNRLVEEAKRTNQRILGKRKTDADLQKRSAEALSTAQQLFAANPNRPLPDSVINSLTEADRAALADFVNTQLSGGSE